MLIFTRIVVFALLSITIPHLVLSYPEGSGTCDVTAMSSQGHGAPLTSGAGGFSLVFGNSTTTSGSYSITVKGPKSIKGLLLYTQDSKAVRTGDFVVPSKFQSKTCGGTGTNSLTHKDSNQKSLPLSFTWSPASDSTTNITVRAIVVVSFSDWYQLSDLTFDPKSGSVDSSVPQDTSSPSDTSGSGSGSSGSTFFQQYSLFIIVIIITAVLYVFGSFMELALKRQQVKARAFAKAVGGFGQ